MGKEFTPHYNLAKPVFNVPTWGTDFNDNMALLDALIFESLALSAITGIWINTHAYSVGQRVADSTTSAIYTCLFAHTSANTPTTFAQDRVAHPTYWAAASLVLTPRGAWAQNTVYNVNDLAYQVSQGVSAICTVTHTSTAVGTIRTDAANWVFIIDLASGAVNSNVVSYDHTASGLTAVQVQAAIDEVVAAVLLKAPLASPTFTGTPLAPTQSTGDNSTRIATTAFVAASLAAFSPLTNKTCRVASTANVVIASALENGDTIDGVVLATNDRVLLKNQTLPKENGIYVAVASGAASRATDADTWIELTNIAVNITAGTANAGLSFRSTINPGGALGTDDIPFAQFGGTIALPLAVPSGGTGSTTAAAARTALGLAIGTDVQAFDSQLSSVIPQNSQSANYTLVLGDSGKQIFHPAADTTPRTWTIPANGSVAYIVGTVLTFQNQHGAGAITIAITTDTMRLAGTGTTGSRTLAADGLATALKTTATEWIISGTGLA